MIMAMRTMGLTVTRRTTREAGYEYGSETTDENAGFRRPKPPAGEEPPRAAGRRSRQTRSGDEDVSM